MKGLWLLLLTGHQQAQHGAGGGVDAEGMCR